MIDIEKALARIKQSARRAASALQSIARAVFTFTQMLTEYKEEEHPRVAHLAMKARKARTRKKNLHRIMKALKKKAKERDK